MGNNYWRKRALALTRMQHNKIDQMSQELSEAWERAIHEVEKEIEAWYSRFANEQGMSLQDAKKALDSRSMKALRMDLKEFEEKAKANYDGRWTKELQAASARVHLSRLEAIQLQIRHHLYDIYRQSQTTTAKAIVDTYTNEVYQNEYLKQSLEGKFSDIQKIPIKQVEEVLQKPWASDGRNWSNRLWDNREKLTAELQGELTRVLLQGKSPAEAGKRIASKMGVGKSQALRLVNTECTYAQTLADKNSFQDMGVKKVQFLATLEAHTCEICGELDEKIFLVNEAAPGITAPPIHPHCRCTLVPYFEDMKGERWMRDPDTEKGSYVEDMTFEEWKEKYVPEGAYLKTFVLMNQTETKGKKLRKPKVKDYLGTLLEGDKQFSEASSEFKKFASPKQGKVEVEKGVDIKKHKNEINIANWLFNNFGGNITVLEESNEQRVKTSDYLWNNKFWDLKDISSERAVDSALRHGLKQIAQNPGGIILDYVEKDLDLAVLIKHIKYRVLRSATTGLYIILKKGDRVLYILKYKKE